MIDVHTHYLPPECISRPGLETEHGEQYVVRFREEGGATELWSGPGVAAGFDIEQLMQLDRRQEDMDANGVTLQILSVPPPFGFAYEHPVDVSSKITRFLNDALVRAADSEPERFRALATLPLQSAPETLAELERVVEMGMVGVSIGSHVGEWNLDDPNLTPFFEAVSDLGLPVFVHSTRALARERLARYHLLNLIGNPTEDAVAAASLILGGVLEKHRDLRVCIAHGGGSTVWLMGRWDRGWKARPEAASIPRPPSEYVKALYFDSLTHSDAALRYLVDAVGGDHVMAGTDYPYDMRESDPRRAVKRSITLADEERRSIGDLTASHFFAIHDA